MDILVSLKMGFIILVKFFRVVLFLLIGLIIKSICLGRFVFVNGYFLYICMCLV